MNNWCECKVCGKKHTNKNYCCQECYWVDMKGLKNEKAPNWKGDKAGVSAIHRWLESNYGKPNMCESPDCEGRSSIFDWAKKSGKDHEKKRDSYLRLCRACHIKYDFTDERKQQAIKNLAWVTGAKPKHKRKLTDEQVVDIYHLAWKGSESQYAIARHYGIHQTMVCFIKNKMDIGKII